MWLNLTSDDINQLELTDYAERYLVDRLSVIPGVARVRISGGKKIFKNMARSLTSIAIQGISY